MTEANEIRSNVSKFKEILLELHRGAAPDSLFDAFHEVIASADAEECEEIRRQLIIEGVPRKRARKWTDAHLSKDRNRYSSLN